MVTFERAAMNETDDSLPNAKQQFPLNETALTIADGLTRVETRPKPKPDTISKAKEEKKDASVAKTPNHFNNDEINVKDYKDFSNDLVDMMGRYLVAVTSLCTISILAVCFTLCDLSHNLKDGNKLLRAMKRHQLAHNQLMYPTYQLDSSQYFHQLPSQAQSAQPAQSEPSTVFSGLSQQVQRIPISRFQTPPPPPPDAAKNV